MMKDSLIVGFFVTLFNKIVEVYDGSVFEKIIKSVCGFFIKRSENSSICSFFKKEQKQDSYLSNSIFYRIVTFPIKLIKLISQKCSGGITKAYNNSQIIKIFNNVTKISIRQFGFIMAGYFASMLLFYVIFNSNVQKAVIIIAGVLLILSGIMCLFDFGISSVISSSVLIKPFLNMFNRYSVDKTAVTCYRIDKLMVFIIVAVILGAISGAVSPIISFLAIAGAVFVVFVLNNAFFGACFTVFAAPVFPTMVCVGLSLLTICAYILELIRIKDKKFIFTGTDFFVVCFICLQIFSAITSFNPQKSIPVCIVSCTFILMYFVIINTAYDKDRWYKLLLCFIGAGVVISLIGIYQNFFGGSTSTSWVDEDMFEDIKTRVYATLDNPNVLGQYLVLVIPVTFAAMWSAKKTFEKIIFAVCVALMGACLLFTWSRAAWVGAVLAIAFYFVMKDRRWVTVGIIVLLLLPFILPESIMSRITSIGNTGDSSTAYRVSVWIASFKMACDYFLGGIGLGTDAFERVYQNYALNGAGFALHSHNFYIQLVVEMGIFALVAFLFVVLLSYKQIVGIKEKNTTGKNVAIAVGGALAGYMFCGVAESLWYNYRMILVFFILIALLRGVEHNMVYKS